MADALPPGGDEKARVWLIAGPTASGKSALALDLALRTGGEIVNADALQLYRDLRVLTARPTAQEEALVPHHLYGVADASETWSVGRWLRAATPVIEAILARGRPALVVGGTGLYFRALTEGLAEIPEPGDAFKIAAAATYEQVGEEMFRLGLAQVDKAAEARIAPGDRQRLLRAYAVFWSSGTALSRWQDATTPTLPPSAWRAVAVEPPREALYARIDGRMLAMAEAGALEEAALLAARRLDPELPAMKAVGLRELAAVSDGRATLQAALAEAAQNSRRYAKRQLTWLRNQAGGWPRIESLDRAERLAQALALLGAEG